MGTAKLDAAATVLAPVVSNVADATGATGVMRVAGTATSTAVTIPAGMRGRYWDALSIGVNTRFGVVLHGSTAPTLVYATNAAFGTGAAASGKTLLDGVEKSFYVPGNAKQLVYIMESATGTCEFVVSGQRTGTVQ